MSEKENEIRSADEAKPVYDPELLALNIAVPGASRADLGALLPTIDAPIPEAGRF